jgi:hypothetical protein
MKKKQTIVVSWLALFVGILCTGTKAFAVAAPTDTNAFLYPVYDLLVLKIGAGPLMFCVGFIGICVAGYYLYHHALGKFISALVATGMIAGAVSIVPTLGAIF